MPSFDTHIIHDSPKAGFSFWGWFLLFIILLIIMGFLNLLPNWTIGVLVFIFTGAVIVLIRLSVDPAQIKEQHFGMKLILSPESIQVGENIYNIHNLSSLKIQVNHYAGQPDERNGNFFGPGKFDVYHNGADNYLKFYFQGKPYKYAFYLKNEFEKEKLIEVIKIWYKIGVKFVEETAYGNSFLFRKMDYKLRKANIEALRNENKL